MIPRRSIRRAIDHLARWSSLLRRWEHQMCRQPTVLMYHRVLPDERCAGYPFPSLVMPLSMFEQQMQWLARRSVVVTLASAVEAMRTGTLQSDQPRVVVSFDDGYRDNVDFAAPALERLGLPGTFFVTTAFVAGQQGMWYDRTALAVRALADAGVAAVAGQHGVAMPASDALAADRVGAWVEALKQCRSHTRRAVVEALERDCDAAPDLSGYEPMTPDDVRRLRDQGHEVGAHSVSHEILTTVDDDQLDFELRESRRLVADWSGSDVAGFCYPNGSLDDRVVAATHNAGYAYAVTTSPPKRRPRGDAERVDLLRIPRVDITRDRVTRLDGAFDLVAFRAEVCGLHEAMR